MRIGARRGMLAAFVVVAAALIGAALPLAASAFLPDGRIYEQVSPPNKEGNSLWNLSGGGGIAEANGNGVVYETSGPVQGVSSSGMVQSIVSRRTPGGGWSSSSALPAQVGFVSLFVGDAPLLDFTPDFSHVAWISSFRFSNEEPAGAEPGDPHIFVSGSNPLVEPAWVAKPQFANAFPVPGTLTVPLNDGTDLPDALDGISADGKTVFFTYSGTLLPQDEPRRAHCGECDSRFTEPVAWGFYEWHDGELAEAGELPNGSLSPFGAVPAAYAGTNSAADIAGEANDYEVSVDGTNAYFVSPDPMSEAGFGRYGEKPKEPIELYVREILPNGQRKSVLVSHSELPGEEGAEADEGAYRFSNSPGKGVGFFNTGNSFVFGSPDGSHAYFASQSRLTTAVPKYTKYSIRVAGKAIGGTFTITAKGEGGQTTTGALAYNASPAAVQAALEGLTNVGAGEVTVAGSTGSYDIEMKTKHFKLIVDGSNITQEPNPYFEEPATYVENEGPAYWYDYSTATNQVTYMNLEGAHREDYGHWNGVTPATITPDGSHALFWGGNGEETYLDVWSADAEGGKAEKILVFPAAKYSWERGLTLPAEASDNGNVYMFSSTAIFPQFNDGAGVKEIFRYEVSSKELTCVSCPPPGVAPIGGFSGGAKTPVSEIPKTLQHASAMSADGSRIFFDSPDPLVGADTNGLPDVYEWENGHIYLISPGVGSTNGAALLDASANGGDVFFATEASLIPSDNDQALDIYDARIPQPGDNPPPSAVPCEGDVCQGPPSVPQLLTPAASAVFNGLGNIPPQATPTTKVVPTKCKKGFVRKKGKCVKLRKHKKHRHSKRRKHKKSNRRGK